MLLKLDQPQALADTIGIIAEFVNDAKIKVNDKGLSIIALDPANVALVFLRIPKQAFSTFESQEEVLGVSLQHFKMILRRCKPGSSLVLEKEDNLLKVHIQDKIKRSFTLALIDLDTEDKEIPNLEFSSKVILNSSDFNASIEDCAIVADACNFSIQDNKFHIDASGLHSARSIFSSDEAVIEAENCKSKYSIEYLQKFIKGSKIGEKTIVQFSQDYPLRMDYRQDNAELTFILAPRVETD